MDFQAAFHKLLGHEGGLSMDPKDNGNWTGGTAGKGLLKGTKYGISAAVYPGEDIAGLTPERAREIYRRDYWGPAGCDAVPDACKFDLFDAAVLHGPGTAVRMLQDAVAETPDGILGPRTLQAVQSMPPARLLARFNAARLVRLTHAPTWPSHGKGWVRRVAANLKDAA